MKVIGITGRIGCGKSTLARLLAERHGCPVIDADALGHEALRDPQILPVVVARFGPDLLDPAGAIDRVRLADRVFEDPGALEALNGIVHPWIVGRAHARLADLRAAGKATVVLIDAALLLDWKDQLPLDRIVHVRCPDSEVIRRLRLRGVSEEEARRRLASQMSEEMIARQAHVVIDNGGSEQELEHEADLLWRALKTV